MVQIDARTVRKMSVLLFFMMILYLCDHGQLSLVFPIRSFNKHITYLDFTFQLLKSCFVVSTSETGIWNYVAHYLPFLSNGRFLYW